MELAEERSVGTVCGRPFLRAYPPQAPAIVSALCTAIDGGMVAVTCLPGNPPSSTGDFRVYGLTISTDPVDATPTVTP